VKRGRYISATLLAFLPAVSAAGEAPYLRGGVTYTPAKTVTAAVEEAGLDPERGQGFSTNMPTERGGSGCPTPVYSSGNPPPLLLYQDDEHKRCIWWAPNPDGDNGERPSTPAIPGGFVRPDSGARPPVLPTPPPAARPPALPMPPPAQRTGPPRRERTPQDFARYAFENAHGLADGVGNCVGGMIDAFAGAGQFLALNFDKAALLWGVQPGQSLTIAAFQKEIDDTLHRRNMSAYESGMVSGRRLCLYGIIPAATRATKAATAAAKVKLAQKVGATRLNPVPQGPLLSQMATDAPQLLEGKWISTPDGAMKLGPHIAKGTFGSVFEHPDGLRVVKVSTTTPGSAATFPTQLEGAQTLQKIGVPTLNIDKLFPGKGENPAILVMDKLEARYPGAKVFTRAEYDAQPLAVRNDIRNAIADAHIKTAAKDFVLADGHLGNIAMVPKPGGGYTPVVVDADMVVPGSKLRTRLSDAGVAGDVIAGALQRNGAWDGLMQKVQIGDPIPVSNSAGWTRLLLDARFPRQGIPRDGTLPQ
jgi:hypothetical protein